MENGRGSNKIPIQKLVENGMREGNPGARVTLARGFKVTLVKRKISQEADTSQTSQPA